MKAGFLKRFLLGLYILIVFISFMDAAVYLSMRSIWFSIDKTLIDLSGAGLTWAVMFFILFIASFIYLLTFLQ